MRVVNGTKIHDLPWLTEAFVDFSQTDSSTNWPFYTTCSNPLEKLLHVNSTDYTIVCAFTCHRRVGQWVVSQGLDYFYGKQDTQSGNVLAGIITLLATDGVDRKSRRGPYHALS